MEERMLDSPSVGQDEKLMAMLSHLLGIPTSFIAPLVIYLIKKDSKFVAFHSLQALFFQLAIMVGYAIAGLLWVVGIGVLLSGLVGLANLILAIVAGIKSYNGEWYEYPVVGRLARQMGGV